MDEGCVGWVVEGMCGAWVRVSGAVREGDV